MKARDDQTVDITVERLMKLRDIAIPFAREMEAEGQLTFTVFMNRHYVGDSPMRCGTKGCLLGWMTTLPEFEADGWSNPTWPQWNGYEDYQAAAKYFGITESDSDRLFDPSHRGLEERAQYVDEIIRAKLEGRE